MTYHLSYDPDDQNPESGAMNRRMLFFRRDPRVGEVRAVHDGWEVTPADSTDEDFRSFVEEYFVRTLNGNKPAVVLLTAP